MIATDCCNAGEGRAAEETLNVETLSPIAHPSDKQRWAIRFNADKTVTIVIGARDYGRGWFSAFFAGVAATRLGIPFQRFRIYYSANHPAALQTPSPYSSVHRQGDMGPFGRTIADTIEQMCDQVIAKGRTTFAIKAGISEADVGFDQTAGRFFILDINRSSTVMEVAMPSFGTGEASRQSAEQPGNKLPGPTKYIPGQWHE